MAIPKHDEIRAPALKLLAEVGALKSRDFEAPLARLFALTDEEISQKYESGNGRMFYDRISLGSELHVHGRPGRETAAWCLSDF